MTLKEQYWKDGTIFHMSTGDYRMVWGDKLIDAHGYIPGSKISDCLINTNSAINERVIEVYAPNRSAGWFEGLIKPITLPIWSAYDKVYTMDEIKEKLGLSEDTTIFIFQ